jgi:hypothetical protein
LKQTYELADEAKRLINGLIAYLRNSAKPARQISEEPSINLANNNDEDGDQTNLTSSGK